MRIASLVLVGLLAIEATPAFAGRGAEPPDPCIALKGQLKAYSRCLARHEQPPDPCIRFRDQPAQHARCVAAHDRPGAY